MPPCASPFLDSTPKVRELQSTLTHTATQTRTAEPVLQMTQPSTRRGAGVDDAIAVLTQQLRQLSSQHSPSPPAAATASANTNTVATRTPTLVSPRLVTRRAAIEPTSSLGFDKSTPPPVCHCTPDRPCACSRGRSPNQSEIPNDTAASQQPHSTPQHARKDSNNKRIDVHLAVLVDRRDASVAGAGGMTPLSLTNPSTSIDLDHSDRASPSVKRSRHKKPETLALASPLLMFEMDLRSPSPRPLEPSTADASESSNRSSISQTTLASWSDLSSGTSLMALTTPGMSPAIGDPASSPYSPLNHSSSLMTGPLSIPVQPRTKSCILPVAMKTSLDESDSAPSTKSHTHSDSTIYRSLRATHSTIGSSSSSSSSSATGSRMHGARSNSMVASSSICPHNVAYATCELCFTLLSGVPASPLDAAASEAAAAKLEAAQWSALSALHFPPPPPLPLLHPTPSPPLARAPHPSPVVYASSAKMGTRTIAGTGINARYSSSGGEEQQNQPPFQNQQARYYSPAMQTRRVSGFANAEVQQSLLNAALAERNIERTRIVLDSYAGNGNGNGHTLTVAANGSHPGSSSNSPSAASTSAKRWNKSWMSDVTAPPEKELQALQAEQRASRKSREFGNVEISARQQPQIMKWHKEAPPASREDDSAVFEMEL